MNILQNLMQYKFKCGTFEYLYETEAIEHGADPARKIVDRLFKVDFIHFFL